MIEPRDDVSLMEGYHSPQVDVKVRLNTNEAPEPPPEAFTERLRQWLDYYNRELAHPYRWTYAGTPLVRDTPFARTRRAPAATGP